MARDSASRSLPLVVELRPAPDPSAAFQSLAGRRHLLFLDSALRHPTLGRYSFLACDPFEVLTAPADGSDALAMLADRLAEFSAETLPGLPPWQGGAAGLLSYDLGRSLERVPRPRFEEFAVPALAVGLYDTVLAFDHRTGQAWIISHGFPEREPAARRERAVARAAELEQWLSGGGRESLSRESKEEGEGAREKDSRPLLAPQFEIAGPAGLTSNFSRLQFEAAIARGIEYIRAGDIFQVNLAQRLLFPAAGDPVSLYLRLRERNPATFAGYFDLGDFQLASASPERFVRVAGGHVETRPIKGTRPRSARPLADMFSAEELRLSEKDRAENVMIVDLLRNDLSRVCTDASVRVTQLCELEHYQFVQHLVSAVEGKLAPGRTPLDLVRAAFPGGSITGAPKVRAMEIIAELEPTARGAYCGSLGYLGFDGSLDLSILIRTITCGGGWWQLPVGGGITSRSDPADEYEETLHKARGLVRALLP